MKRVIVGTAGHIDHGKTRLIEALTGIDCDRWVEEKSRGITLDLGFAHLENDDLQIGFVDVPGHERFLHNALAGLGGIRVMLLVVAADEGVKPQTREHLAICSLLRIPAALVALTKSDLVSSDLLELAELEVEELLAETPFARTPILSVSSHTGEGVDKIRNALIRIAREQAVTAEPDRAARLPVDRAFLLKGLGLVVTGTLTAGEVAPGDLLEQSPHGRKVRVRSVQVHGQAREKALPGERTALQLTGIDHDLVVRGDQLIEPSRYTKTRRLAGRFTLLPEAPRSIKGSTIVRLHLFSSEIVGRLRPLEPRSLEPGDSSLVEIRLSRPAAAVPGDRFIIRRPSPPATLGGGEVLDPSWRPRRGRKLAPALKAITGDRLQILIFWIEEEGETGISTEDLASRLGSYPEAVEGELASLAAEQKLLAAPSGQGHGARWLAPAAYKRVTKRTERVLRSYFRNQRLAVGMPKAEAVERILPGRAAELADVYLDWLSRQSLLTIHQGKVNLPGREAELSNEESQLSKTLLDVFEEAGLTPPAPTHLAARVGAKPQTVDGVLRYLTERRKLLRLPGGLLIAASAVARVSQELKESDWTAFSVGDFKARFGLTRKWAIPLLEHLDSSSVTRRVGDQRQVVR